MVQQRAWGCQTRRAGSGRRAGFSSPRLGPGHSASPAQGCHPGPGPHTPPRTPGTAGALLAPRPGPSDPGITASRRRTRPATPFPEGSSLTRRSSAAPSPPQEPLVTAGLPPRHGEQLWARAALQARSPTPRRTGTPARQEEEGEGREDAGPHAGPQAPWHEAQLGRGCLRGLPAPAARRRPRLRALSLSSRWAVTAECLSCSGPLCPPPAPACSGAAAAAPAHPSPGQSGSTGVGGGVSGPGQGHLLPWGGYKKARGGEREGCPGSMSHGHHQRGLRSLH